ncbi:MAG TPA: thioredoxin domain-containing protein [Candidatus Dormibacteraeota bacterium]
MPNRLAAESSPYLRQHAANPVEWWPWGAEAWEEARRLDRPVLLSVGYSACHWCHVMAHESFENAEIAALQNELFVSIKVDREERPDVDSVYMGAVQAMTGQGGWPMTVFCTPGGVPFFGGTYFPPEDRLGMRGYPTILRAAADAYRTKREAVDRTGAQLREALTPPRLRAADGAELTPAHLDAAAARLVEQTDRRWGGFGGAPKFPHAAALDAMLRHTRATGAPAAAEAAMLTLDRMARGGVYDQVGGGFHRYSVDAQWAVPHFEKMLYDNAQLAPVYLHAWQLSGEARWRDVCVDVLDHIAREMRLEGGGLASTLDADSEGGEGAFYAWTPEQLRATLADEDAALASRVFGVVGAGNFEHGSTVLSLPYPLPQVSTATGIPPAELRARLDGIRARMLDARARRPPPGRDDKVISSWNALALAAFAEAGGVLVRDDYVQIARSCAGFLLTHMRRDGVLLRSWLDGAAKVRGFLEDSAFLCDALLTLHAATGEARWFGEARTLADDMLGRFRDPVEGFYDTAVDGEPLLVRPRTLDDNAVPAGQSMAAVALLRLAALTGEDGYRAAALGVVAPLASAVARTPLAFGNLAWALELAVREIREVAIAGPRDDVGTSALLEVVRGRWDPTVVLAWGEPDGIPLLHERPAMDGRPTAYVCRGFVCDRPVGDPQALRAQLKS